MVELKRKQIERYLTSLLRQEITVVGLAPLGQDIKDKSVKGYGYGTPIRVDYELPNRERQIVVLHTMSKGSFGHEHMADRAQKLLWEHQAFNRLPRHVRALDVGGFQFDGSLMSIGKVEEFCLVTEYVEGQGYFLDFERLRDHDTLNDLDLARADALCDYLIEIHSV